MASPLPPEVERFIVQFIDSLEELEILLLVRGPEEHPWKADEVYAQIKTSEASVARRLQELAGKGLLQSGADGFKFQPEDPKLTSAVDRLALAYKERRLSVIECLFAKPLSALQIFSDAFKIKRNPKDG